MVGLSAISIQSALGGVIPETRAPSSSQVTATVTSNIGLPAIITLSPALARISRRDEDESEDDDSDDDDSEEDENLVQFTIVNLHTKAVATDHIVGVGFNSAIAHNTTSGIIEPSETAFYAIPTGYSGMMAVMEADHGNRSSGSDTIIEASFVNQAESGVKLAFDVSMVTGFTLPVTCSCGDEVVTGCSFDLNEYGVCPESDVGSGLCRNPLRGAEKVSSPTEFFRPCENSAYTYVHNHAAVTNGNPACLEGVTCCIGTACAPHPEQCVGIMANTEVCQTYLNASQ
ncbi:hypothetical protein BJ170DRAFT_695715 [Xylariales sp. AK1849]|nr:hypothetical protein BJ170DRAFT_695715 [Xylariales sp. AK1849]